MLRLHPSSKYEWQNLTNKHVMAKYRRPLWSFLLQEQHCATMTHTPTHRHTHTHSLSLKGEHKSSRMLSQLVIIKRLSWAPPWITRSPFKLRDKGELPNKVCPLANPIIYAPAWSVAWSAGIRCNFTEQATRQSRTAWRDRVVKLARGRGRPMKRRPLENVMRTRTLGNLRQPESGKKRATLLEQRLTSKHPHWWGTCSIMHTVCLL